MMHLAGLAPPFDLRCNAVSLAHCIEALWNAVARKRGLVRSQVFFPLSSLTQMVLKRVLEFMNHQSLTHLNIVLYSLHKRYTLFASKKRSAEPKDDEFLTLHNSTHWVWYQQHQQRSVKIIRAMNQGLEIDDDVVLLFLKIPFILPPQFSVSHPLGVGEAPSSLGCILLG